MGCTPYIIAVRNCTAAEVRAVLAEAVPLPREGWGRAGALLDLHEQGGWVWIANQQWFISPEELDRLLSRLGRPGVLFATERPFTLSISHNPEEEGALWYLTVHGGPEGRVRFVHYIGWNCRNPGAAEAAEREAHRNQAVDPRLALLHEDGPKVPFDRIADHLADLGVPVPGGFRDAVAGLRYTEAAARYRRCHAEQVSDALTRAGIPHDPAAVQSVLLWENASDYELDSRLGNLPRLLYVLGIRGDCAWVSTGQEPEEPPAPAAPVAAPPTQGPPEVIRPVLAQIEPLGLTPVAGGPVSVPLDDIGLLSLFPEALGHGAVVPVAVMVMGLPGFGQSAPSSTGERASDVEVEMTANGFRFGLPNHRWLSQRSLPRLLGEGLAHLLYHLPDGALLDVAFAVKGSTLIQHYRGRVEGGEWQISDTYPALTREPLSGGLQMARAWFAGIRIEEAESEAKAEHTVQRAARSGFEFKRKGRLLVWDPRAVKELHGGFIFFGQLAARAEELGVDFDQGPAGDLERLEVGYRAGQELMRQLRSVMPLACDRAAPTRAEALFRGNWSAFRQSNFTELAELEQQTRARIDTAMAELGFAHLGDLIAEKRPELVLRLYRHHDGLSYGLLGADRTMYHSYEFYSRLTDGSLLTTTTDGAASSVPERRLYIQVLPGREPAALYDKHLWGIGRFRSRNESAPQPLPPTLAGAAEELHMLLCTRV
jgi:hypothetical protein